ncbi:DoxX family protein [Mycolicibacterium peregrinum]|uniref:DoxX family protein n=1 Tax=Mycolicibacterium peregrinum TaxID=43304 RepID=UPI003AAB8629
MTVRNVLILLARVGLGVIFVAHGWQKFVTNGIAATQQGFAHMGHGLFVSKGGFELVLALAAPMLLLIVTGAGRFSVDGLLGARLPWNRGIFANPQSLTSEPS